MPAKDEALLDDLRRVAVIVGHTPTGAEITEHSKHGKGTYERRFGSLKASQERAGLIPNRAGVKSPLPPSMNGDGRDLTTEHAEAMLQARGWEYERRLNHWRWRDMIVLPDYHLRSRPDEVVEIANKLGPAED